MGLARGQTHSVPHAVTVPLKWEGGIYSTARDGSGILT